MKKSHIVIAFLFFSTTLYAGSQLITVKSFNDLQALVAQMGEDSLSNTLVVMDDDNTLTTMSCPDLEDPQTCQYMGGPAWGSWQGALLGTKSHYRVADNLDELMAISGLILAINDMVYAEKVIPQVLSNLTNSGAKLMVLTARGSSDLSATENQLFKLDVQLSDKIKNNLLSFINDNALKNKHNQLSSLAGPFIPKECGATLDVSYQQGVMYATGQNKGLMLQCLLNKLESSTIKNIYFIDDTLKNVVDVNKTFKDSTQYSVKALHYTYLDQKKNNFTKGDNAKILQQNAHIRWESIREVLKEHLQKPRAIN